MHVSTKEVEYCKVEIQYQGDVDAVREKTQEAIAHLRKLQIPGFRAGKAPDYVIKAKCKDKIKQWVVREMAVRAYDDAVFETKMKTIGQPQYSDVKLDGNVFSCTMVVLKKPDFKLVQYKDFEIPRPHINRDADSEVERTIQDLRMRFGDIEPYKDGEFVESGDQVTMDYSTVVEGKEDNKAEGVLYSIGSNQLPGVDENLLGMLPGDEREFDVGGTKFKVKIHMGAKRKPCPMNDELATKVGLANFGEVKQKLYVIANERITNQENHLIKQQIITRIVDGHDFAVPSWLLTAEAQHISMQNNIKWDELTDEQKEPILNKAKNQIKLSLILDSIREAEPESVLSDSEAINVIKQRVALNEQDPDKFIVESQKSGQLLGILAQLKDEFTFQWLVKASKIID
jgi:trigger factor